MTLTRQLTTKLPPDTIFQPDLLVVCNEIYKPLLDFPPVLVVEILSPSTALKDRYSKFQIYEELQIKYYLIISREKEDAEIYTIENGSYLLKQTGRDFTFTFSFEGECTATIDFKEIW